MLSTQTNRDMQTETNKQKHTYMHILSYTKMPTCSGPLGVQPLFGADIAFLCLPLPAYSSTAPHMEPRDAFLLILDFSHFFILPLIRVMTAQCVTRKQILKVRFQSPAC